MKIVFSKIGISEKIVLLCFSLKLVLGAWVGFGVFGVVWWVFCLFLKTTHIM